MKYIPKMYQKSIFDISYDKLKEKGIKCLVFDLDNTLGLIDQELPNSDVVELFNKIKKDFDLYILSNNSKTERVDKYKDALGCKAQNKALKPFTRGLRRISEAGNYKKSEMAIIGDQLVTDIYAGTRYGIITVLVDPLGEKDLKITGLNRKVEAKIISYYQKQGVFERGKYYE